VITLSIAAMFIGLLIPAVTAGTSESRTIDGLINALSYGFMAFVIGLIISIIIIIKVPSQKIKKVLYFTASFLIIEIVFIVLGNLNNWWR